MNKHIIAFLFIIFCATNNSSLLAQSTTNTKEITEFKKENPNNKEENTPPNTIVTSEKMENPNKKKEQTEEKNDLMITDKKTKNPRITK